MWRRQGITPSRGTVIPDDVRRQVMARDGGRCVCSRAGFPESVVAECGGNVQLDHVRASHGMGMKSDSTVGNLAVLSANCHYWKTRNGKVARPLLLAWIAFADAEHTHVEPVHGCSLCVHPADPYPLGLL